MGLFIGPHARGSAAKTPSPTPKSPAGPSWPGQGNWKKPQARWFGLAYSSNSAIYLLCDFRLMAQPFWPPYRRNQWDTSLLMMLCCLRGHYEFLRYPAYKSHPGQAALGGPRHRLHWGLCSPQLDRRFRGRNASGWNPDGFQTWG